MARVAFRRRIYSTFQAFWADVRYMVRQRAFVRRAMRELIDPAFRERLMLAVTEVNGCRYCSYFHAGQALKSGISESEIRSLLTGRIAGETPEHEHVALLYAQHWAESDARPDPEAAARLVATYGEQKARAIELVLRVIRMGNLLGNTADYVLYRLSLGRMGLLQGEAQPDS